jgi:hypothetical protein
VETRGRRAGLDARCHASLAKEPAEPNHDRIARISRAKQKIVDRRPNRVRSAAEHRIAPPAPMHPVLRSGRSSLRCALGLVGDPHH